MSCGLHVRSAKQSETEMVNQSCSQPMKIQRQKPNPNKAKKVFQSTCPSHKTIGDMTSALATKTNFESDISHTWCRSQAFTLPSTK